MAKKKRVTKKAARRRETSAKRTAGRKAATKRPSRKAPAKRARSPTTSGLDGWIVHTDLASTDPDATRAWCQNVLGWTFAPVMATPTGDYHLFTYSQKGGGGVRRTEGAEPPGALPYAYVADTRAAYEKALAEGATEMQPPTRVMEGVTIAIVRAPGGVPMGFTGP